LDYLIRVENLGYRYQQQWVVRGVGFDLVPGELVGLIGPNGSGKSTLLKLLDRLLVPREGQLFWEGDPLERFSPIQVARRMALVTQEPSLIFPPTVLETVLMGRSPHLKRFQLEGPRDLHLAEEALQQTEVLHLKKRLLSELSSGERQRVYLARALCQEPRLLLLDEPTAFLDLKQQVRIFALLTRLNQEKGLTILVASHDLNLAAQYCDRLILIRQGELAAIGTPQEVINEAVIESVFDIQTGVDQNPFTHTPRITLRGQEFHKDANRKG
jgi:iron complex transport system ATP-binding protein